MSKVRLHLKCPPNRDPTACFFQARGFITLAFRKPDGTLIFILASRKRQTITVLSQCHWHN